MTTSSGQLVMLLMAGLAGCSSNGMIGSGGAGGTGGTGGGPYVCETSQDVLPGRLCVRGTMTVDANNNAIEVLKVGDPLKLLVAPRGCWSSACTVTERATCSVHGSNPFAAEAKFCIGSAGLCSLPDCSGAGWADCEAPTRLTAGPNTVTLGELSIQFAVPSTFPPFSLCAGSPF